MKKILILCEKGSSTDKLESKIAGIYGETNNLKVFDIHSALNQINSKIYDAVVVVSKLKEKNGMELLNRVEDWDFEAFVYDDMELYRVETHEKKEAAGFVLKALPKEFK